MWSDAFIAPALARRGAGDSRRHRRRTAIDHRLPGGVDHECLNRIVGYCRASSRTFPRTVGIALIVMGAVTLFPRPWMGPFTRSSSGWPARGRSGRTPGADRRCDRGAGRVAATWNPLPEGDRWVQDGAHARGHRGPRHDVFMMDTRMGGYEAITSSHLIQFPAVSRRDRHCTFGAVGDRTVAASRRRAGRSGGDRRHTHPPRSRRRGRGSRRGVPQRADRRAGERLVTSPIRSRLVASAHRCSGRRWIGCSATSAHRSGAHRVDRRTRRRGPRRRSVAAAFHNPRACLPPHRTRGFGHRRPVHWGRGRGLCPETADVRPATRHRTSTST